jgi:hypothetical protein
VGNKAKDKPLNYFRTVNGNRSQGLKSCQLYDDDDDDEDDDDDGGGGGGDDDDDGNRIFKLSSILNMIYGEHSLCEKQRIK